MLRRLLPESQAYGPCLTHDGPELRTPVPTRIPAAKEKKQEPANNG